MKVKAFLVGICSLVVLSSGSAFSENPPPDQTKSPLVSWLQGLYHKLTNPAAKPVAVYDSSPQPVPGKTIVIYYGNHPEVVSLGATGRARPVKPSVPTK